MGNIWFTADLHLGHERIIEHCRRPFSSVGEMDSALIKRWNDRVQHEDTIYVVGDFIWKGQFLGADYVNALHGSIMLLPGNHEIKLKHPRVVLCGEIKEVRTRIVDDVQTIVLCHYAMRVWPKSHFGAWHLFGHSHGGLGPWGKSFDVGVDAHDYQPWSLDEIVERMATLPDNFNLVRPEGSG